MSKSVELIEIDGKKVSKTSTGKRKFHNKSKNGCDNCKRRRVKCDEMKPYCQKCLNMRLDCLYTPPQPRKKRTVKKEKSDDENNSLVIKSDTENDDRISMTNSSASQLNSVLADTTAAIQKELGAVAALTATSAQNNMAINMNNLTNGANDSAVLDNLKRLKQLQNLQQQQAQLLSQINAAMGNSNNNNINNNMNLGSNTISPNQSVLNSSENLLLPPLVTNTPVFSNTELNTAPAVNNNSNILSSNLNNNSGSPSLNLQALGMSISNSINNSMSPNKFNPNILNSNINNNSNNSATSTPNLSNMTNSNGTLNNANLLSLIPNLLNSTQGSIPSNFSLNNLPNIDLQEVLNMKNINGIVNMINGTSFNSNNNDTSNGNNLNKNSRAAKASNAEVALATMQQQQEQQVNKPIHNENNLSKNSNRNSKFTIKNILDSTALPLNEDMPSEVSGSEKATSSLGSNNNSTSSDSSGMVKDLTNSNSQSPMASSTGSMSPTTLDTIPRLIELSGQAKLNLVDLKLFFHYCTTVWSTITAAGISGPEVWKTYLPELAFDFPFLMHSILAFSATHLSRTESGLERYVSSHRLEALKLLREAVLEISDENTDALVASSLILIMDSLANASNTSSSSDSNTSAWIFHVKGAVTILTAVWPLSESSKFYNLISVDLSDLSDVLNQENRTISELVCFDESISDLYPVEIDSPYLITLAYLDQLHREKNQLDFLLRVFAFPALLDRTFLALLMTGDLGAMRIMRSYYKMLRGFTTEVKDKVWFLEGVSQVLPQDVDEYSGGGGMHMMLDFLGGGLPSMTTTNLSEFM